MVLEQVPNMLGKIINYTFVISAKYLVMHPVPFRVHDIVFFGDGNAFHAYICTDSSRVYTLYVYVV